MKAFFVTIGIVLMLGVMGVGFKACGVASFFVNDAIETGKQEFSASDRDWETSLHFRVVST